MTPLRFGLFLGSREGLVPRITRLLWNDGEVELYDIRGLVAHRWRLRAHGSMVEGMSIDRQNLTLRWEKIDWVGLGSGKIQLQGRIDLERCRLNDGEPFGTFILRIVRE